MSRSGVAYEDDFYAWTRDQAARIRRAGAERNNAPIDWENVAEEIESRGRSEWSEVDSRLSVLVVHLLKLLYCPELHDRCLRPWRLTVREQRRRLYKRLRQSPSMRPVAAEEFADIYAEARGTAALEADADLDRFPAAAPFTLDQALDPAYPAELFPPEWRV
ncbi:DUF29 domain-containing protein [Azospirillum halopraeferens]|uniref:DUF29 domain-containing protein n=1 Tax=Azospirillum halopraeferens TaxID=34010 RepID=UPI0003F825D6|nr:DUF29 domain-containing protein [Azospirillum halopraeferens]